MAKIKTKYICQECGYETVKWLGRCPECGLYSTLVEEIIEKNESFLPLKTELRQPMTLKNIKNLDETRVNTGINELDRVLGGGIVTGSLTLVGGDPGIGKSTLLIQICQSIGEKGLKILYISGEESVRQIKLRADRLNITTDNLLLLSETNIDIIENTINETKPNLIIIDSIQTMFASNISSAPGSVSQVRECTSKIMHISKLGNISALIVVLVYLSIW